MVYKLKTPIVINGNKEAAPITIEALSFREEACAGDMRDLPLSVLAEPMTMTQGQCLKLASRLCGQAEKVLDKMTPADAVEVAAIVLGFFRAGPETGATASP